MNRKWYFLEYVGALICAFMANVEYQFSYMNGIHLFLWIIYFCLSKYSFFQPSTALYNVSLISSWDVTI